MIFAFRSLQPLCTRAHELNNSCHSPETLPTPLWTGRAPERACVYTRFFLAALRDVFFVLALFFGAATFFLAGEVVAAPSPATALAPLTALASIALATVSKTTLAAAVEAAFAVARAVAAALATSPASALVPSAALFPAATTVFLALVMAPLIFISATPFNSRSNCARTLYCF